MRKLKLQIDELKVDSFAVNPAAGMDGTVRGNVDPNGPYNQDPSFNDCYGGGVNTVGTCIGPTYCCGATWKPSCALTCIFTDCNTCWETCAGGTCGGNVTCLLHGLCGPT